ncbi:protein maternal effect lethal 26-like [Aphidius gifuensis]|uniref:protein maternal effect lethal 26-like n=1 Tax=Aphidius gifuensis TaxID=684658 RepID=UPI001CDC7609|nr:protein maternal effect lethal 26-like [Aphidius gifuensis]
MSVFVGPIDVTGMECCEFTHEWTISNFSHRVKETNQSPIFSSHYGDFDDKWILEILSYKNCLGDTRIVADLQLQSFNNNTTSQLQTKCKILINDKYKITKEHNFSKFSEKITCSKIIPTIELLEKTNDELKICCTITMSKKQTNFFDIFSTRIATPQLSEDWKKLLLNEKSSDITIQVGQKSFRAIKGILGVRSPVFSAM